MNILDKRFHLVTGKGGVGKTTVAAALALKLAKSGKKVLLAEMSALGRINEFFGYPHTTQEMIEVYDNLYTVNMNTHDTLKELALSILKYKIIYEAVFENRLVRYFLRFIPSLGELIMMGKMVFHEQEIENKKPKYDALVIDCPATGHGISFLRVPFIVTEAAPSGVLKGHAKDMVNVLVDNDKTALHIVTIAEEMSVNEAVKVHDVAKYELQIPIGYIYINKMAPQLLTKDENKMFNRLPLDKKPVLSVINECITAFKSKYSLNCQQKDRIIKKLNDVPTVSIPFIFSSELYVDSLEFIANIIGGGTDGA